MMLLADRHDVISQEVIWSRQKWFQQSARFVGDTDYIGKPILSEACNSGYARSLDIGSLEASEYQTAVADTGLHCHNAE